MIHVTAKNSILLLVISLGVFSQGCGLKTATSTSSSAQPVAVQPAVTQPATAQRSSTAQEAEAVRNQLMEGLFGPQQDSSAGAAPNQRRDSASGDRPVLSADERKALAELAFQGVITPEQFQNYLDHRSFNPPPVREGRTRATVQHDPQSLRAIRMAAERGDVAAQNNLGVLYAEGEGVPQDNVLAHKWFNLAAAQGNRIAAQNRDEMASRMSTGQIGEAQRLAREWSAANRAR